MILMLQHVFSALYIMFALCYAGFILAVWANGATHYRQKEPYLWSDDGDLEGWRCLFFSNHHGSRAYVHAANFSFGGE
jgi:hypothetical protein